MHIHRGDAPSCAMSLHPERSRDGQVQRHPSKSHQPSPACQECHNSRTMPSTPFFYSSPRLDLGVIMLVPALVAAEFLISPSVSDLMSALQTDRHLSRNLWIVHTQSFYRQISSEDRSYARPEERFFFFFVWIFLFFIISRTIKLILAS